VSWFSWTSPTRLVLARCYLYPMLLRRVAFPDFCEPCLPSPADKPPAGAGWLHEIKHDGFRMLVRRNAGGVQANPGYSSEVIENPGIAPPGSLSASIRALNSF
jgi:hypothetical protein